MGLLPQDDAFAPSTALAYVATTTAPEVTMLSDGLMIRVGPHPDDLCLIENLGAGESIWNLATGRLVDLDGLSCVTLDGAQLADMGLSVARLDALGTDGRMRSGWLAFASSRVIRRAAEPQSPLATPRLFLRLWPEGRLLAEVEGRPVLIRGA